VKLRVVAPPNATAAPVLSATVGAVAGLEELEAPLNVTAWSPV
jgi:hypothetical protein